MKLNEEMQALIKKEGLDDAQVFFSDYETFEEIPLFSRWSHVNFLKKYDFNKRNEILLKQSVNLVNEIMDNAKFIPSLDVNEYFICVSITNLEDIGELGCISPNIYISKRRSWLLNLLELREIESPEIKMIKMYLLNLNINKKIVCVSKNYGHENDRIYIVDDYFIK